MRRLRDALVHNDLFGAGGVVRGEQVELKELVELELAADRPEDVAEVSLGLLRRQSHGLKFVLYGCEQFGGGGSLLGVGGEHRLDQLLREFRNLYFKNWLIFQDFFEGLLGRATLEGQLAVQQGEGDAARSPHVRLVGVAGLRYDLWRHVVRRPNNSAFHVPLFGIREKRNVPIFP